MAAAETLPHPRSAKCGIAVNRHNPPVIGILNAHFAAIGDERIACAEGLLFCSSTHFKQIGYPVRRAGLQYFAVFIRWPVSGRHANRVLLWLVSLIVLYKLDDVVLPLL